MLVNKCMYLLQILILSKIEIINNLQGNTNDSDKLSECSLIANLVLLGYPIKSLEELNEPNEK